MYKYTNEQMEFALTLVESWLWKLISFYEFYLSIVSTGFALVFVNLTNQNYLMTFIVVFTFLNIMMFFIMMASYGDRILLLFDKRDKGRRAIEVLDKLSEDPAYYEYGLTGDLPKEVITNIKKKISF